MASYCQERWTLEVHESNERRCAVFMCASMCVKKGQRDRERERERVLREEDSRSKDPQNCSELNSC